MQYKSNKLYSKLCNLSCYNRFITFLHVLPHAVKSSTVSKSDSATKSHGQKLTCLSHCHIGHDPVGITITSCDLHHTVLFDVYHLFPPVAYQPCTQVPIFYFIFLHVYS